MTDALRDYLAHQGIDPGRASLAAFESYKANPPAERTTHPASHHRHLTDAAGQPFTLGGETVQDRYDRRERQRQSEEFDRRTARPVPASYGLSEDTPEKRAASAHHAAETAERIRREQSL